MLPMFYQQLTAVSSAKHNDFNVDIADYSFAAAANTIPVGLSEFSQLLFHYPIVFMLADNSYVPVAVVGTDTGENLFVDRQGQWLAPYLPAYVRRYPFTVASVSDQSSTLTVCVDESYPGCNREGRGEALFTDANEQTEYLQKISQFLQQFELDFRHNQLFTDKLSDLGLLESTEATFIAEETGKGRKLDGFFVINRERLKKLNATDVDELHRSGALELIHQHLASLNRFSYLFSA